MEKIILDKIKETDSAVVEYDNSYTKLYHKVAELVGLLSEENGYIAFNDDSGYPSFEDYSKEYTDLVMAVRLHPEFGHIEFMVMDDFDETFKEGWFNPSIFGRFNIVDFYDTLTDYVEEVKKIKII